MEGRVVLAAAVAADGWPSHWLGPHSSAEGVGMLSQSSGSNPDRGALFGIDMTFTHVEAAPSRCAGASSVARAVGSDPTSPGRRASDGSRFPVNAAQPPL